MASSLVESLAAPFEPARFEDDYKAALEALIDAKLTGGEVRSVEPGAAKHDDGDLDDLVSALRRSVDAAKARSSAVASGSGTAKTAAAKGAPKAPAAKKTTSKTSAAKKTAPPKKAAAEKAPGKTTAKKAPAKKTTAAKTASTRRSA